MFLDELLVQEVFIKILKYIENKFPAICKLNYLIPFLEVMLLQIFWIAKFIFLADYI